MLIGLMGRLLAGHKPAVLAIVVLQLVQTTANLLLPTLNAAIIDDGIVGRDHGRHPSAWRLDGRNCRRAGRWRPSRPATSAPSWP